MDHRKLSGSWRDMPGQSRRFSSRPSPHRSDGHPDVDRRKQALHTLLDVLSELQEDGSTGDMRDFEPAGGTRLDKQGHSASHVDTQTDGAVAFAQFEQFKSRVNDLDRELQVFTSQIMELGSSVLVLSASSALRQNLVHILSLVRQNAAMLFPDKFHKETAAGIQQTQGFTYPGLDGRSQSAMSVELDVEDFPDEIERLANNTLKFLGGITQFPDYGGETMNASLSIFAAVGDLRYWASTLREFHGQFKFPSIARYMHDLSADIGERLQDITNALVQFAGIGAPIIRVVQRQASENLLSLSTIATFFSAVTATTIQYTLDRKTTTLDACVNAFWYSSLVFSIASAVNCLIGLTWKQAMYRSLDSRVPWWVRTWIERAPLVFLAISVVAFSVGFVLFTYTSGQPWVVCTMITAFTAFTLCGMTAASGWLILEGRTFSRHRVRRPLPNYLNIKLRHVLSLDWAATVPPKHFKRAVNWSSEKSSKIYQSASRSLRGILLTRGVSPGASSATGDVESSVPVGNRSQTISPVQQLLRSARTLQISRAVTPTSPETPRVASPILPAELAWPAPARAPPRNERLKSVVRSVMMTRFAAPGGAFTQPRPDSDWFESDWFESDFLIDLPTFLPSLERLDAIKPALQSLSMTQSIMAHQVPVRHLAFSPNGKYLATCSWDRISTIIKVSDSSSHRVLAHPHGFVRQVMWSPNGSLLLTRLTSGINVWTEDGVRKQRIDRKTAVHSINWFANGTEFLSIESNEAVHMDVTGKVLDRYPFERLRLHDGAITLDGERLVAVATLEHSKDGFKPVKVRAEKRIVVYNLLEKEIENQVPVFHDVRDITLTKGSRFALVSYEHKAPPQLWRIGMVKGYARLALVHTYMPNQETDFAGPSYFGGKDDHLVLCASKAGDIHIWDRESGSLLHHIRPGKGDGDGLTCIAWNNALDKYMFATGSRDGAVRFWHADAGDTGDSESLEGQGQVLSAGGTSLYDSSAPATVTYLSTTRMEES